MPSRKKPIRRKKAAASVGLTAAETKTAHGADLDRLTGRVEADGGAVLAAYNDPFGGKPLLLVALPLDKVEPTPYQRDPSDAHVKRLMGVIETIGSFLDPLIVVPGAAAGEQMYFTPNGNHRLQALKKLGAKAVVALLLPDPNVAFKILALNTEKAHNLREKSLETIRMARALARTSNRPETDFTFEFKQPAFLTLGVCYDERPRLSGGAYQPILRRVDAFLEKADGAGAQGARAPRPEDPEARRRGIGGGREVESARSHQPVSETVRRLAGELHPVLESDVVRLRRGAGQDHRERGEAQCRSREAGRRRESRRRDGGA